MISISFELPFCRHRLLLPSKVLRQHGSSGETIGIYLTVAHLQSLWWDGERSYDHSGLRYDSTLYCHQWEENRWKSSLLLSDLRQQSMVGRQIGDYWKHHYSFRCALCGDCKRFNGSWGRGYEIYIRRILHGGNFRIFLQACPWATHWLWLSPCLTW